MKITLRGRGSEVRGRRRESRGRGEATRDKETQSHNGHESLSLYFGQPKADIWLSLFWLDNILSWGWNEMDEDKLNRRH